MKFVVFIYISVILLVEQGKTKIGGGQIDY